MEHAVFADLSNLQLVLTRFVYENRAALPISWRHALGFRRSLALAQGGPRRDPPAALRPPAPREHGATQVRAVAERRDPASRGASLRTPDAAAGDATVTNACARRSASAGERLAVLVAATVAQRRACCTLDLTREGLGRVQVYVRAHGARVDCAVLCSREAQPAVDRALIQARERLARSGVALVAAPHGVAS
ncbi:hypothetical protein EPN52_00065 [bacterium]|nr:MAG: hypothetical protein EPN52_00065 [bacterium]